MAPRQDAPAVAHKPFVPADVYLPEITIKAIVLGVLLSVILASANVYLGLFAGLTVSASIPAAVISMGILRMFRNRNILENNIVQTSTSAGESLAAGVIFTIPALVILGVWSDFTTHAMETILLAAFAGVLGVIFTVPLRRAFIVEAQLRFPEGIACAEVLEVGEEGGQGVKIIALGGLAGGLTKFFSTGLELWRETADHATRIGNAIVPFGSNLSPALLGVGYIVGPNIATVVFLGGVIAWLVAMPIYTLSVGLSPDITGATALYGEAFRIWDEQIRYMGVGAMAVGGLYALVRLARPLYGGIASGIGAYRTMRQDEREEAGALAAPQGVMWVALLGLLALLPLSWVFQQLADPPLWAILSPLVLAGIGFLAGSVFTSVGWVARSRGMFALVAPSVLGLLLVAAYVAAVLFFVPADPLHVTFAAGLAILGYGVGGAAGVRAFATGEVSKDRLERDLPVLWLGLLALVALIPLTWLYYEFSGSAARALLLAAVMLVFGFLFSSVAGYMAGLVGSSNNPISGVTIAATLVTGGLLWLTGISDALGPIGTIAAAATIASAGALAGDNMQDLKTGYLVGATPRMQQSAQIIGVLAAAAVIPFILEIIHQSYGICIPGENRPGCLAAPQASLIASVAGAFFGTAIPWTMAAIGAGIAALVIAVDIGLESREARFRLPVLAVAVGVYLPIELTTAIFIGGMVALAVRAFHRSRGRLFGDRDRRSALGLRNGLLFASGLIAGEAILGILLGIPRLPAFAPEGGGNPLDVFPGLPGAFPLSGMLVTGLVLFLLYYLGIRPFLVDEERDGAS